MPHYTVTSKLIKSNGLPVEVRSIVKADTPDEARDAVARTWCKAASEGPLLTYRDQWSETTFVIPVASIHSISIDKPTETK